MSKLSRYSGQELSRRNKRASMSSISAYSWRHTCSLYCKYRRTTASGCARMISNTFFRGVCWCRHCTNICECACKEPVDFCASMEVYPASALPKAPPSGEALLPNRSWHGDPCSLLLQSGQKGHTRMPNKCSYVRFTRIRKPSTAAKGSLARIARRSACEGTCFRRSSNGTPNNKSAAGSCVTPGASRPQ